MQEQFNIFNDESQNGTSIEGVAITDPLSIQTFKHPLFGILRVVRRNNEPWFVAKDAFDGLDIRNTTDAIKRLDDDEKARLNLGLPGGATNCVSFPGFLSIVLGSRKKEAKEYKRWVTHEVLPSVHKNGGYIAGQETDSPEVIVAKALVVANSLIEQQQKRIASLEPIALVGKTLTKGRGKMSIGTLAKYLSQAGFKIGQNNLFKLLRQDGYLMYRDGDTVPTQRATEMGIFVMERQRAGQHSDGGPRYRSTTRVTPKGVRYFIEKYAGQKTLEV